MSKNAFSLVEIAIVLIIVGILLAAATMSKDLIKNSKLKKVLVEIETIHTAIKTFHGAYSEMPGDFDHAVAYFGAEVTQDGDGDGRVEYSGESYQAFIHLDLARVLHGEYTANEDDYSFRSRFPARIRLLNTEEFSGFVQEGVNVLQIGLGTTADDPVFTPDQAKQIDGKLDDGAPNTGRTTYRQTDNTTAANCTNNTEFYYVANELVSCNLVVRTDI